MNPHDRLEVREMLTDILSGHLEKIEGQYRLMTNQLANIEIQTTKTNGRVSHVEEKVNDLEHDIKDHPVNCNQAKEIKEIKDDLEEYRMIKKYPKLMLVLLTVSIAGYGVFSHYSNKSKKQEIEDLIRYEIRGIEGVSKVTRGGYVKYNQNGMSDSVKLK